jgi:chloramphenicol-sensitive protein RarD
MRAASISKPSTLPESCISEGTRSTNGKSLLYALGGYALWGFVPLYFHALAAVSPWVVLSHRVIWSSVFLGLMITVSRGWLGVRNLIGERKTLLALCASAILVALNWVIFIYAVSTRQILQASMGYFINPLLTVALGMIFLRERLGAWQLLAVGLAVAAVLNLSLFGAGVPWLAISLALSFGFYGLVRKKIDVPSLHGLFVETLLLLPLASGTLLFLPGLPNPAIPGKFLLLFGSGLVTAAPLLLFGVAIRRLPLSTIAFLQYLAPTLQFLVGLCVYHEPLSRSRLISFAACWIAIAIYLGDLFVRRRRLAGSDFH